MQLPKSLPLVAASIIGNAGLGGASQSSSSSSSPTELELQSINFNSSFALTPSQIKAASLSDVQVKNFNLVMNFERTQLANGGPSQDDFYTLPPLSSSSPPEPGSLLKVQDFTDTSPYVLAPNTALSRIMYTTTNLNGTVIPATAFILWPFTPREFGSIVTPEGAAPVVLWEHGTSGFFADHAPSARRDIQYGNEATFALALEGYAVVAPDYGGIGISTSWDNSTIPHQYLSSNVSAHDALYARKAAMAAFPGRLSDQFVAFGHSQGGGVAWATAEVAHSNPSLTQGYLGAIAGSPTTKLFDLLIPEFVVGMVSLAASGIWPSDFSPQDWLTDLGVSRVDLLREVEGATTVGQQLLIPLDSEPENAILKPDWKNSTYFADAYSGLSDVGAREFAGPLLVIQGTEDMFINESVTRGTVEKVCEDFGEEADLEYMVVNGTGHVPTLDATRGYWMRWIGERFEGKETTATNGGGCKRTDVQSWLPVERYAAAGLGFPQWAGKEEYGFEVALFI